MEPYDISSISYLNRARERRAEGTSASLFYAALEVRSGVEARLREYLEHHEHVPIGRRAEWNVSKLHRTAESAFQLQDQIARVRIFRKGETTPSSVSFYTPVTSRLKKFAQRFGEYLHAARAYRKPADPFWAQFGNELDEAIQLLDEATSGTLYGPVLFERGTGRAHMNVIAPDDAAGMRRLLGVDAGDKLRLEVCYFPTLAKARVDAC